MGELGEESERLHFESGQMAKSLGVSRLYAYGTLSHHAAKGFGENGFTFSSMEDMAETITKELRGGINILVKASRSMGFEQIVSWLIAGEKV
ncbi:MAG: hypothetical protein AAF438_02605 [Pseudomonadota bacterium]